MKLTARCDDQNTERLNRVPAAMARQDCAKLVVAGCRGGWCQKRWGVLGMLELISGRVLWWFFSLKGWPCAVTRKPSVFLANRRRAARPLPDPLSLNDRASSCMISRRSQ
jgi:hypothetical protein